MFVPNGSANRVVGCSALAAAAFVNGCATKDVSVGAEGYALDMSQCHGTALDCLDENQRMVFVLFELEQLEMQEIADAMQAPLTTCYSRVAAARNKVRSRIRSGRQFGAHTGAGES